mgnify:CR=1 FL=1
MATAWLLEVSTPTGPQWAALDDINLCFFLTPDANWAHKYKTEALANDARLLLSDPENAHYLSRKLVVTEHAWPEVAP